MRIEIDEKSGFCDGVMRAIRTAENYLKEHRHLYCLGDIVHNNEEVLRLQKLGLEIITPEQFATLKDTTVMFRAHGESPETCKIAKNNNVTLIDATCPVVLQLQRKIKNNVQQYPEAQTVIFGKVGHAEVIGLQGQTEGKGKVISSLQDIETLDFTKPTFLYAQTTQNQEKFREIAQAIQQKMTPYPVTLTVYDTICRRVSNRVAEIQEFVKKFDVVCFVSDHKSSNGLYLFVVCKEANPNTHFITQLDQLELLEIANVSSIGICGATSTPLWLMEQVANLLERKSKENVS